MLPDPSNRMLFHVVLSQNGHLTLPVHELLESYVSLRYDDFDLDSVSPYLTRLANDFLISITVDSENEFKGPYVLTQIICNQLFKTDYSEFEVVVSPLSHP